nr:unnamed protein product [Digitaria exilis]
MLRLRPGLFESRQGSLRTTRVNQPRGRNQDKNPRLFTHHQGNEWISTAITCLCRCDQIRHRHAAQPSFPMANFGQGRPPLGESNLLPVGQEIWFGSLRFQTCGDDYHMRILQEEPSDQLEPPHSPSASSRRWSPRAARRAADVSIPPPAREGEIPRSGSQERAAPFLPQPMFAPRATTAHPYPYGLCGPTVTYASFVRTAMSCHPASDHDLAAPTPDDSRTESEDGYAFEREGPGWDYSGLRDSEAFLAFQTAADYCFGYSDDEYDPTRECFVISDGRVSEGSTSDDDGEDDDQGGNNGVGPVGAQPPDPSDHSPSKDERHPRRLPRVARPHDLGSGGVSPSARSDHEPPKQGHEHSTDARRAGQVAQARILAEDKDDDLAPRTNQKLIAVAALLRAMPEAATPEGRKLHLEAQKLVENATRQQAESSASRLRRSPVSKGERGGESSVRSPRPNGRARAQSRGDSHRDMARCHTRAPEAGTLPARVPARSRLRDTRGAINGGDARNTLNQMRQPEGSRTHQRGRTNVGWNRDVVPEPAGMRVFSRNIRTAPIPPRFRQPTTITKYSGQTDPRVWLNDYRLACQLGGATDDAMVIRNLPLHLADSARTWLEHLPPNRIHDWNDLVETFVRNFQGTYVRPGNMWDLRGCNQKRGESLRDFIRRFSKRCTKLPNITDTQIIHFFLESTTSYNRICKLGRDPPPDANRLFEVASTYVSGEEAANAIFNGKKGKRPEETPAEGSKPRKPSRKKPTAANEVPVVDPSHKGPRGLPCGGESLMPTTCSSTWDDPPPTEILANACDIQQLRQGRLSRVLAYASRLRQHLTSLRLSHSRTIDPSSDFLSRRMLSGSAPTIKVVPAAAIYARERTLFRRHATPEKARTLPHEVAVTALTVIMTPHQEVEGTFNTPTLERAAFVLLIRGSNSGPPKGFDRGPRSTESGIIDGTLEARALEETNRLYRGTPRGGASSPRPLSNEPTLIEQGMDVRSNYPLSAHLGILGSIPIVGSMDRLLLRTKKNLGHLEPNEARGLLVLWTNPHDRVPPHIGHDSHRNTWRERSRLPPRREEVIVLLIRGSNLGPSKGFDKGPRSTESGIIDAWVASSSVPSNEEHEVRRKLEISRTTPNKARFEDLRRSLGGYTRGCASAPHGFPEPAKEQSTSLRRIEFHSRGGSGATQRPTIATTPRHPSRSRWTTTLEQGPTSRETFTLERVISVSLRSRHELATLGMTPKALRPINPSHDDAPLQSKSRGSLLHATAHTPERTPVKSTRNNLTWQQHCSNHSFDFSRLGHATILEGDPRRRLQRLDLDAKEGHHVSHCHVVSRSWKARFPLAYNVNTTNTCTRTLPPWSIKGEGKPMQRGKGQQELISFSHLACNPLIRATRKPVHTPLLDVRPRGRNQDKNPVSSPTIRATSGLAPQSLVCADHGTGGMDYWNAWSSSKSMGCQQEEW